MSDHLLPNDKKLAQLRGRFQVRHGGSKSPLPHMATHATVNGQVQLRAYITNIVLFLINIEPVNID